MGKYNSKECSYYCSHYSYNRSIYPVEALEPAIYAAEKCPNCPRD